jgi:hypothetical protein
MSPFSNGTNSLVMSQSVESPTSHTLGEKAFHFSSEEEDFSTPVNKFTKKAKAHQESKYKYC